ncbi:unnamed protein product, partial [Durusdinium trenchii]
RQSFRPLGGPAAREHAAAERAAAAVDLGGRGGDAAQLHRRLRLSCPSGQLRGSSLCGPWYAACLPALLLGLSAAECQLASSLLLELPVPLPCNLHTRGPRPSLGIHGASQTFRLVSQSLGL